MTAIGFAVQSARGHPDVQIHDMGRGRLYQMQYMQPQYFFGAFFLVCVLVLDIEIESPPQVLPFDAVSSEQCFEIRCSANTLQSLQSRVADGAIA